MFRRNVYRTILHYIPDDDTLLALRMLRDPLRSLLAAQIVRRQMIG
jgi:hypothetical protein